MNGATESSKMTKDPKNSENVIGDYPFLQGLDDLMSTLNNSLQVVLIEEGNILEEGEISSVSCTTPIEGECREPIGNKVCREGDMLELKKLFWDGSSFPSTPNLGLVQVASSITQFLDMKNLGLWVAQWSAFRPLPPLYVVI